MPKATASADAARQARRHNPLAEEYAPSQPLKQKSGKRKKSAQKDEDGEQGYVDSKASRKILRIGQDLADEESEELQSNRPQAPNPAFAFESRFGDEESDEEVVEGDDDAWGDDVDEEEEEIIEIDPNDLETFNKFNPSFDDPILRPGEPQEEEGQGTNLAALILEKIAEREAQDAANGGPRDIIGGGAPEDAVELPARVVEVYTQVGLILSRYKSGKLPKPFKILPTLPEWETLISITRPDNWTPNVCYEATKLFVSSNPTTTQTFLNSILLERVRSDIHDSPAKKLNVHLYKALKKALYKPAAFFKGILFPLVGDGDCTLREAHIVASVLARVSIPVLHSAAALHRLCEIAAEQMSVNTAAGGATNIFIRVLLEKKYALPYKVIDALVFHFLRFRAADLSGGDPDAMTDVGSKAGGDGGKLPVLWHQCLLAFAQRYRNDVTEDQREALLDLLLVKGHKAIGPEVRRELLEGRGRGVVVEPEARDGGDDTMMIVDS
ncbi:Bystin-domain-containing protein [Saccharata proteae CBS 121410]|uniref:Bystin-domain-containing protein n=1 Tax=Saccharata proteae CBS 121410 TaxID=1314787 RepID=A0A9P4I0F8_9PEZI|nr:Bystin-domain-containing protein [Saccharata proteae CBS 121410]